jgi:hypothetical protein
MIYVSCIEVNARCAASILGTLIGISIKSIHEGMAEPKLHVTGASGAYGSTNFTYLIQTGPAMEQPP